MSRVRVSFPAPFSESVTMRTLDDLLESAMALPETDVNQKRFKLEALKKIAEAEDIEDRDSISFKEMLEHIELFLMYAPG